MSIPSRPSAPPTLPRRAKASGSSARSKPAEHSAQQAAAPAGSTLVPEPETAPTLAALDPASLPKTLEAALARETDTERTAHLHHALGELYQRMVGDARRAAKHFMAAYELAPDRVSAIVGARQALLAQGKYLDALSLFDAELAQCGAKAQRARLLYQKGRLLETQLKRHPDALAAYEQAILLEGDNLDLLRAAARLARKLERFPELDRTLEQMALAIDEDPLLRAGLIAERARLAELRLGAPAQALELYVRALEIDPDVAGAADAVVRLAQSQGNWQQLLQALEHQATRAGQSEVAAAAHARRAEVLVDRLGELEQGIAALQAAVTLLPDDPVWLERLAELLSRAGRHPEVVPVLERLHGVTREPVQRAEISHRIGALAERELQDHALAERAYTAALRDAPKHAPSREALCALHGRTGQPLGLVRVYELELAEETAAEARADLLARLGEVHEFGLKDQDGAIVRYQAALALIADHALSLRALDRVLPALGRFDELAQVYERVVDHAPDDAQARNYLLRLGALHEDRLGNLAAAMHAYRRALERDQTDLLALHALQRAAVRAGEHETLLEALDAEAELVSEGPRWVDLMYRGASLAIDALDRPELAIGRLRRLLDVEEDHGMAQRRLAELLRQQQRWEDLLALQARRLTVAGGDDERVALSLEMGQVSELQLGRIDDAIEHYRRALDIDPAHGAAHAALLSALRAAQDPAALADGLEARIDATSDPRRRAHLAVELGALCEQPLEDPRRASDAYASALKAVPGFRPALEARDRLLSGLGDHRALVSALTAEADDTASKWRALEALMHAAAVQSDMLGDERAAEATYGEALARAPGQRPAQLALEWLRHTLGDRDGLRELYELQLEQSQVTSYGAALLRDLAHLLMTSSAGEGSSAAAVGAFRQLLALHSDDQEALEVLLADARSGGRAAEVMAHAVALAKSAAHPSEAARYYREFGEQAEVTDAERAVASYRMALARDPDSPLSVRGLARAAIGAGDAAALSEAAQRASRIGTDPSTAVALFQRAAALHQARGATSEAAQDLERALALEPTCAPVAGQLARLLQASGAIPRLCDVLARSADACGDVRRAAELYTEVARLRAESLGDVTAGITAAERALGHEAGHAPALALLAKLLSAGGVWARAAEMHDAHIKATNDHEARLRARLDLATLAMERLDDVPRAERALKEVLRAAPDHRRALELMRTVHHRAGRTEAALAIAERLVETASEPADRAEALLALALGQQAQGSVVEAERAYREALVIEGPGGAADEAYRRNLGEQFGWGSYVEALRANMQERKRSGGRLAPTARAIASVQFEAQEDPAAAMRTLEEASAREPDDPDLWDAIGRLHVAQGAHEQAIELYRRQLRAHPNRPALWSGLSKAQLAAGRSEEAHAVGQPLLLLDAAEGDDLVTLRVRQARPVAASGTFPERLLAELDPAGLLDNPAALLTSRLTVPLTRLHAQDPDALGCGPDQRVPDDSSHPVRLVADRVARSVGAAEYEIYVDDGGTDRHRVELLLSEPPILVVPKAIASLHKSALVFHMTPPLLAIGRGLSPIWALDPDTLALALTAAVRRQHPEYLGGIGGRLDEQELEAAERAVSKAIPWLARKKVDEATGALARAGDLDLVAWIEGVREVAARVALLLADDLLAALRPLQTERRQNAFADPLGRELLRLWASETAQRYREGIGDGSQ